MAIKIYIILVLTFVCLIGFIKIRTKYLKVVTAIHFLDNYRNKFLELVNTFTPRSSITVSPPHNLNIQLYQWLIANSYKAQKTVGRFGIGEYVSAFQMYYIRRYEFIVSTIPKLRDNYIHEQEITSVDDILIRSIALYEEQEQQLKSTLKNPFKWFQHGVRFIISFPIQLLNWFGIISDNTFDTIASNSIFKLLAGIVSFASFLSSIVTIFTGWSVFKNMIMFFFHQLF